MEFHHHRDELRPAEREAQLALTRAAETLAAAARSAGPFLPREHHPRCPALTSVAICLCGFSEAKELRRALAVYEMAKSIR